MAGMIPNPFADYFPKALDNSSPEAVALGDKLDSIFNEGFCMEIAEVFKVADPIRTRSIFLDALGQWLAAGIQQQDSEYTKRRKIATAIQGHKNSGLWEDDYKQTIDAVTGLDAQIIRATDSADWIRMGGEDSEPADYYWATRGSDGIDDSLGIDLLGAGDEIEIPGNIYIDLGGDASSPSADELQQVIDSLTLSGLPAYYVLYLGYTTGTAFTVYSGGIV